MRRRLRNVKPRVMIAKNGEKLHKRVEVKVIIQGKVQFHKFVCPAGKGYSEDDIYGIRARVIDHIDHRFPHFEFNEVQIAANAFNYIATGLRAETQEVINEQFGSIREQIAKHAGAEGENPAHAAIRQFAETGRITVFKPYDKDGAAPAGRGEVRQTAGGTDDLSGTGKPADSSAAAPEVDQREAAARCDSDSGVQESGPRHQGDPDAQPDPVEGSKPAT